MKKYQLMNFEFRSNPGFVCAFANSRNEIRARWPEDKYPGLFIIDLLDKSPFVRNCKSLEEISKLQFWLDTLETNSAAALAANRTKACESWFKEFASAQNPNETDYFIVCVSPSQFIGGHYPVKLVGNCSRVDIRDKFPEDEFPNLRIVTDYECYVFFGPKVLLGAIESKAKSLSEIVNDREWLAQLKNSDKVWNWGIP